MGRPVLFKIKDGFVIRWGDLQPLNLRDGTPIFEARARYSYKAWLKGTNKGNTCAFSRFFWSGLRRSQRTGSPLGSKSHARARPRQLAGGGVPVAHVAAQRPRQHRHGGREPRGGGGVVVDT